MLGKTDSHDIIEQMLRERAAQRENVNRMMSEAQQRLRDNGANVGEGVEEKDNASVSAKSDVFVVDLTSSQRMNVLHCSLNDKDDNEVRNESKIPESAAKRSSSSSHRKLSMFDNILPVERFARVDNDRDYV
jgi:hypothetical protein